MDAEQRKRAVHPRVGRPAAWTASAWRSSTAPRSGAKSTATNQEAISAMPTTAKIEKVYSPAALREADRHEAGHRHQRAGQHREGQGL